MRTAGEDVDEYVDEIAERAVQLGGVAERTARMEVVKRLFQRYLAC